MISSLGSRRASARALPLWIAVAVSSSACALEERADFLVGRICAPGPISNCDAGQACLPHGFVQNMPSDFRCRDAASFERIEGREPPLAFCDESEGWICPEGLICAADRVRAGDTGPRRDICQEPGLTIPEG